MKIIETPIQPELEEIRWQRSPMAINFQDILKKPSNILGLSYIPTFGDNRDEMDYIGEGKGSPFDHITNSYRGISYFDQTILREYLKRQQALKPKISILEIGVCRNADQSITSTHVMITEKRPGDIYLGVDLVDKSYLDSVENNVFTMREDSSNIDKVMKKFRELGGDKIDYMFIDGDHSMIQVLKDWRYSEYLSEIGVIGFHDTNIHSGPCLLMEAIDENIYDVLKYGTDLVDWGISMVILK